MDKNHIRKICNKRFANGKAMGGHIRSHLARLPLPLKPNTPPPPPQQKQHPHSQKPTSSPSSSSSLNYNSGGNPWMSYYKSVSHPIYNLANTSISTATAPHDGESEAESPKNPTRRRSKRRRKSVDKVINEPTFLKASDSPDRVSSSVTDAFNEGDAAACLLMLSSSNKNKRKGKQVSIDDEEKEEVDADKFIEKEEYNKDRLDKEAEEEDDNESYYLTTSFKPASKSLGKYKCETCNKSFKSYQALGGHRASHKKTKPIKNIVNIKEGRDNKFEDQNSDKVAGVVTGQRIFRCSFCGKEFESGQALGGHKKVHFPYLGNNPVPNPKSTAGPCGIENFIDLNFPPPEEAS